MHEMPVNDIFTPNGKVQADGSMVHDMYLYQVKKPEESKKDWDYYTYLATIPGDEAFIKAEDSGCPLVGK
jgi:branched-chain amino acid transport system substrate-binding protein